VETVRFSATLLVSGVGRFCKALAAFFFLLAASIAEYADIPAPTSAVTVATPIISRY